jgi:hypothetical protein
VVDVNPYKPYVKGVMSVRVCVVAVVAALVILGLAGSAAASNSFSWDDRPGDSGNALDLTRVDVQNDDGGKILFGLTFGNRGGLLDDDEIDIYLDTDEKPTTGNERYDYRLRITSSGVALEHGTSTGWEDTPHSTVNGSADGRLATVNRTELDGTSAFYFYVRTLKLSATDKSFDEAPDGDNLFIYSLNATKPSQILVAFSPKTPKAGAAFSAVVPLVRMDDGSATVPNKVVCKSTLNGKTLTAILRPTRCVWKLARSAKGKRFVITITVAVGSGAATFGPWRFKVR